MEIKTLNNQECLQTSWSPESFISKKLSVLQLGQYEWMTHKQDGYRIVGKHFHLRLRQIFIQLPNLKGTSQIIAKSPKDYWLKCIPSYIIALKTKGPFSLWNANTCVLQLMIKHIRNWGFDNSNSYLIQISSYHNFIRWR